MFFFTIPFLLINLISFFLMLDDKKKSRGSLRRTSEGALLFAAICFGALGIWAGMYLSRHKTQKIIFIVGVPLALLQNLVCLYSVYEYVSALF
ncbi:MAG: DUF1294 domain-containing protein [Candidatus Pacebacteria bacterium]|nr:DUF1294 domain-containing protein [Candidatus Paceibacterota bacterium]